jgi:hypothetical protein
MDPTPNNAEENGIITKLKKVATKRNIIIILVILLILFVWFSWDQSPTKRGDAPQKNTGPLHALAQEPQKTPTAPVHGTEMKPDIVPDTSLQPDKSHMDEPGTPPKALPSTHSAAHTTNAATPNGSPTHGPGIEPSHGAVPEVAQGPAHIAPATSRPKGVAFVEAVIEPLDYELNKRFWGWRPNDVIRFTDNVNNFQLGVLEVTRRSAVILAERISRTGSTAAFNRNLENAMNWFMIKSDAYWFPSPESKYNDGLNELRAYADKLKVGGAPFYTRTDNLIPLLNAYEDLLGSCDENLVKHAEDDGTPVSSFQADDYFYYAQGVASALETILEAIQEDFYGILESRHGTELIHHAIESCRIAANLSPLIVTEGDLSGFIANHRANIAAPISHARFYVSVLIKTLST